MYKLRIYADTSVFGGCLDREFSESSKKLFAEIAAGRFTLVVSDTTLRELDKAPTQVQQVLAQLPWESLEVFRLSTEVHHLRDAYIDAGVVGPSSLRDAEHIACATVADVDMIVSWNFKHIVHFDKIRGYHGVNMLKGYSLIPVYSPLEVVDS